MFRKTLLTLSASKILGAAVFAPDTALTFPLGGPPPLPGIGGPPPLPGVGGPPPPHLAPGGPPRLGPGGAPAGRAGVGSVWTMTNLNDNMMPPCELMNLHTRH
jgi:hypothetical protein